jgi:hypothetical protein
LNQDNALALDQPRIQKVLEFAYEKAVGGVGGLDSAADLAQSYLSQPGTLEQQADALIRWQVTKAGTSGFLSGLGGLLVLPVTLPANITSVLYVQIRMIAAMAHMGGYDLRDDRVKTLVYACLCGNAAKDVLKSVGITLGMKLTHQAIRKIPGQVLLRINQAVGFRLVTKFGSTGVINLGKAIPLAGGVIGGSFDAVTTRIVGQVAKRAFITPTESGAPEALPEARDRQDHEPAPRAVASKVKGMLRRTLARAQRQDRQAQDDTDSL